MKEAKQTIGERVASDFTNGASQIMFDNDRLLLAAMIDKEIAAMPDLLAAAKEWVAYFDRLARDDEPGDPLAAMRNQFHAKRVEATRAAIAKAEGELAPSERL